MRFRHVYMGLGSLFVILLSILSDPDQGFIRALPFGASIVASIVILLKGLLYVALLHVSRKGLMDYFDLEEFFNKAKQTSEGAGNATIGFGLYCIAIAICIFAGTMHG